MIPYGRPLEELPVLLERVHGTTERLDTVLRSAPKASLLRSTDGKWSALDHLAHLLVLQERFEARVDDFEQRRSMLCEIDLQDQDATIQELRRREMHQVLEEFRLKRIRFTKRVELLNYRSLVHRAHHPCQRRDLRPMDMLLWIAEHDDHHLAQVRTLIDGRINLPRPPLWPE